MIRPPTTSTPFPYTTLFRSDFVDARVGAKAKRVQIAREPEVPFRRRVLLQFHFAAGALERKFRETIVNLRGLAEDRKSTRLNSSHMSISYAVFCLKKKNKIV